MKLLLFIGFVITTALWSSCGKDPNCHNEIYVKNNSGKDIYIDISIFDTTLRGINYFAANPTLKTYSNTTNDIQDRECYDKVMNQGGVDTIHLFIFDAQTVETVPWDTIYKHYMILKRYDLSYDDLVRMNWTITYP